MSLAIHRGVLVYEPRRVVLARETHSFAASEAAALGDELLTAGKAAEAVSAFTVACSGDSGNPFLLLGLADAYLALGERDRARSTYRDVLDIVPGYPWAQNGLGLSAESLDVAEPRFRRAYEMDPVQNVYRGNLAWSLYHLGLCAEAVQHFMQLQVDCPADLGYAQALASILAADGHMGEAAFCLRRALDAVAWSDDNDDKAWYMYRLRAFDEAEKLFNRFHGFDYDLAGIYAMHGRYALAAGHGEDAVHSLKRAVVLSPRSERFHRDLASAFERTGDTFLADAARTRAQDMRRARKRSTAEIAGWADAVVSKARRTGDSGSWRLGELLVRAA